MLKWNSVSLLGSLPNIISRIMTYCISCIIIIKHNIKNVNPITAYLQIVKIWVIRNKFYHSLWLLEVIYVNYFVYEYIRISSVYVGALNALWVQLYFDNVCWCGLSWIKASRSRNALPKRTLCECVCCHAGCTWDTSSLENVHGLKHAGGPNDSPQTKHGWTVLGQFLQPFVFKLVVAVWRFGCRNLTSCCGKKNLTAF